MPVRVFAHTVQSNNPTTDVHSAAERFEVNDNGFLYLLDATAVVAVYAPGQWSSAEKCEAEADDDPPEWAQAVVDAVKAVRLDARRKAEQELIERGWTPPRGFDSEKSRLVNAAAEPLPEWERELLVSERASTTVNTTTDAHIIVGEEGRGLTVFAKPETLRGPATAASTYTVNIKFGTDSDDDGLAGVREPVNR